MYPISLDLSCIRIFLVGSEGEPLRRRAQQLQTEGATQVTLFVDRLPEAHEIKQAHILMVVGLDNETSAVLSSIARLQGVLVNVEDKPDLCDFYFNSFFKRGDLSISISTNGASPTLAQEIKTYLAGLFDEEWSEIVSEIGKRRLLWKQQGLDNKAVGERTREYIRARALIPQALECEAV
jgi:siroheme synthase-like protein